MLLVGSTKGFFYRPPLGKSRLGRDKLTSAFVLLVVILLSYLLAQWTHFFQKIPLNKPRFDDHLIPPPPYRLKYLYGKLETVRMLR